MSLLHLYVNLVILMNIYEPRHLLSSSIFPRQKKWQSLGKSAIRRTGQNVMCRSTTARQRTSKSPCLAHCVLFPFHIKRASPCSAEKYGCVLSCVVPCWPMTLNSKMAPLRPRQPVHHATFEGHPKLRILSQVDWLSLYH